MNFMENLDKNTVYEVLITSVNEDSSLNTVPIGINISSSNEIILKLFSNRTYMNINRNKKFTITFTNNPLLFTKAFFHLLDEDDYNGTHLKNMNYVDMEVTGIEKKKIVDEYSKTSYFKITSKVIGEHMDNHVLSVLNRSYFYIIELLVDISRLNFLSTEEVYDFHRKILEYEKFIQKNGGSLSIESLKIIKRRLELV